jgi:hypothetical protein
LGRGNLRGISPITVAALCEQVSPPSLVMLSEAKHL